MKDVLFTAIVLYVIRETNFYLFSFVGLTPWIYSTFLPEMSDVAGSVNMIFVMMIKGGYLGFVVVHTITWGTMLVLNRIFKWYGPSTSETAEIDRDAQSDRYHEKQ